MILMVAGCSNTETQERINIVQALSSTEDPGCFDMADRPAKIRFPDDSGPHPSFRTEWWYYTGNLKTRDNQMFGYQLTFFRQALSCEPVKKGSGWRTRQLYFAHLGLTDVKNGKFYSAQRMNRESLGIAGSRAIPFKVWVDNWQVVQADNALRMRASDNSVSFDFSLYDFSKPVLQGANGLSQKGPNPTNASYYYSIPGMVTKGNIRIGETTYPVAGLTWFDHEWSTSALSDDVAGWDWFSVHLDDGRNLMVCRIRNRKGEANGFGFGSLSYPDGRVEILHHNEFTVHPEETWKSPETGITYPAGWRIALPEKGLALSVVPLIPNQEHTHSFAYWEGAARFVSDRVQGLGYIELTGY